jgi:hypothetical protein
MITPEEIKIRCSSIGYIMTEPKKKTESLSETCKNHLVDVFVSAHYHRREEISSKFLEKGNEREQDAITLFSRLNKSFFKKNDIRLENEFLTGEPDMFKGESIYKAEETIDTKTSWSANTFFRAKYKALDEGYKYQGRGYQALTGSKFHTVAYCLVNGLAQQIEDEKRRLAWKMGILDPSTNDEAFVKKCRQIERNHIFDLKEFEKENPGFDLHSDANKWEWDIPMKERLFTFSFERDEKEIELIYEKVKLCRQWMKTNLFHEVPERIEVEGV